MAIKKSTLGNLSAASLDDAFRCSECLHFKKAAHPAKTGLCSTLGVRGVALAPKCFTPDVTRITKNSDTFVQLATIFSDYSTAEKRLLIAVLRKPKLKGKNVRKELRWGMKVYFHGLGADYVSNYLSGYLLGQTSAGHLMITGSPEQNTRGKSFVYYATDSEQLMTPREWKTKKAALVASGKILDPKSKIVKKISQTEGDPPTIDSAPQEWHDKMEKKRKAGVAAARKTLTVELS